MGSQVTAQCECGVEAEILVGGGMMDFTTTCYFPCLCDRCNKVVQVNLLATKPRCPDCGAANPVPYDDLHERFRCHEAGTGARYTANRRPLELVYFEEVDDEAAAKRRESQLKRWSHAKKQALVDGDTQRLRDLAKSRD